MPDGVSRARKTLAAVVPTTPVVCGPPVVFVYARTVSLRLPAVVVVVSPAVTASPSAAATRPVVFEAATTAPPAAAPAASLSRLRREPAGGPLGTVSTCEAGTGSMPGGRGAGWSF